jgi:hypothetical protein
VIDPVVLLELVEHFLSDLATGPGLARDRVVTLPDPPRFGHGS